jgi:hypothetical protein
VERSPPPALNLGEGLPPLQQTVATLLLEAGIGERVPEETVLRALYGERAEQHRGTLRGLVVRINQRIRPAEYEITRPARRMLALTAIEGVAL